MRGQNISEIISAINGNRPGFPTKMAPQDIAIPLRGCSDRLQWVVAKFKDLFSSEVAAGLKISAQKGLDRDRHWTRPGKRVAH